MKASEIKYSRKVNLGNYEAEEFSATAVLAEDEGDMESLTTAFCELKKSVLAAVTPGSGASESEEETEESKPGKKNSPGKKRGPKPKPPEPEEEETEEEESEEEVEETEEEAEAEETEEESEEETEEEEAEEEEETPPAKTAKAKGGKSKAAKYDRANETHKKLFAEQLTKINPKWNKDAKLKEAAKKLSAKLQTKDFMDKEGKMLPTFIAELKKGLK
jgi:outer membrane biosynthesis protein TonB